MGYWSNYYKILDRVHNHLSLPDPDKISVLSVIVSAMFPLIHFKWGISSIYAAYILLLVLFLDYLDGVAARQRNKNDEHVDIACDRVSELVIFMVYPAILYLVVINIWLSILKLRKKITAPLMLPLRHLFLGYILIYGL